MSQKTPLERGFRMPAEWQRHRRCWIAWPGRSDLWRDLEATQQAFGRLARTIHRFEPVSVVASPQHAGAAGKVIGPGIEILEIEIDDAWVRDTGPVFLRASNGEQFACVFRFNAWGEKHAPYDKDACLGATLAAHYSQRIAGPWKAAPTPWATPSS